MGTTPIRPGGQLNSPPPLPPSLAPRPALGGLAGEPGGPSTPGGGPNLQRSVIQKLAMAEKLLSDAAGIMPELAPVIDDVSSRLRAGASRLLFSTSPQGAPQGHQTTLMGGVPPTLMGG